MIPKNVEEYILFKPTEVQERLNELRGHLIEADPDAIDELKWGKPALVNNGILYVYAAAKNDISLHPKPSVISHLKKELGSRISSEKLFAFLSMSLFQERLWTTLLNKGYLKRKQWELNGNKPNKQRQHRPAGWTR